MSGLVRMVLAFLPLAAYFFVLGVWQSGRKPRVVSGPRDFTLLAFGLGGMIAFGPLGEALIVAVFRRPSLPAWLAAASLVGLMTLLLAARARKRLVVYQVEAADLHLALGRAMEFVAGDATRTLHGYEDIPGRRGVTVEVGRRLRFGVVEAHGDNPEALIEAIRPELIARLSKVETTPTRLASAWFALACLTLILPLTATLIARPEVRAAIRRMGGG